MNDNAIDTPNSDRRLWTAVGVLTVAAAAAAAAFAVAGPKAQAQAAPAEGGIPVAVATVQEREVTLWSEFSGRLEAVERVELRPRVAGQVQQVHFREGMLVQRGELLVTLDPAPYAAEVERAAAQVAAAQARATRARGEHERARRLLEDSAISQRDYEDRANAAREADANVRAAQAQLQQAELDLGYTRVRAPITGRIGRIEVTAGNLVAAGPAAPVLATLVSQDPIYASFDSDEQVVLRALGQLPGGSAGRSQVAQVPVRMHTEGTEGAREGRLQLIDNQVDAKSGTIRLRAIFANRDGSLIPGQFARIRMGQPATTKAVLVADRVVGTDQDKKFVWVVDARNQAVYREVTLGAAVDGQRVVTAGLQAGERIVVNGLQRVRPGALLQPQVAAAAAPAAAGTAAPTPTAAAKPAGTAPAGTTTSGTGAAQADAPAKART